MDYAAQFIALNVLSNTTYPHNDIGVSQLFYDLHRQCITYVTEAKSWFVFTGKRWQKDEESLRTMELAKAFSKAYASYAHSLDDGSEEVTRKGNASNAK